MHNARGQLVLLAAVMTSSCADLAGLNALTRVLVVEPEEIDFGNVYVGGLRTVDVSMTNEGTAPARFDPPSFSGVDPGAFVVRDAPQALIPGAQVIISVDVRPPREGELAASLVLENDAGRAIIIPLRAVGIPQPSCDDDNECTDEEFDPIAEACARANREGSCDDNNALHERRPLR